MIALVSPDAEEVIVTMISLAFPFLIPTYTVWKHPNWKGFLLGALALYGFMLMAIHFLLGRYPSGGPGGLAFPLWLVTGWLWSAVYCALLWSLRTAFPRLPKR